MDTQWIIWFFVAVILLIIFFIAFVVYRKKQQYDFVFKMMKRQKKEQERVAQKEAFEAKREAMSSQEASVILNALGGRGNIVEIEQNAIRIRVQVQDKTQVDEQALRHAGVSGIIKTAYGLQLIVGDRADQVAQELKQIVEQS